MEELKESQIIESDFDEINEKLEDVQDTVNSIHKLIVTARINDFARKANRIKTANKILDVIILGIMAMLSIIGVVSLFGMVN